VKETLEELVVVRSMLPVKGITLSAISFFGGESRTYLIGPTTIVETDKVAMYALVVHSSVPFQNGTHTLQDLVQFHDNGFIEITGSRARPLHLAKLLTTYVAQI